MSACDPINAFEEIKRWTAKRKTALVLEIIQGKTSVSEASRSYDLPLSEIESWMEDGSRLIGDWIHFYNHRRPHQALNMRTPAEAFALAA